LFPKLGHLWLLTSAFELIILRNAFDLHWVFVNLWELLTIYSSFQKNIAPTNVSSDVKIPSPFQHPSKRGPHPIASPAEHHHQAVCADPEQAD